MPPAEPPPASPAVLRDVGLVVIGRNEGERLRRCFDSLPAGLRLVVYVDSASTDDSVEQARRRGIHVLALDMSLAFTAARARNAGLRQLRGLWPDVRYAQVVDGDCALVPGWLEAAVEALESNPGLAMVCGRRREVDPGASIYNRLCDAEWDTPVGDTLSCGGDALLRVAAVVEVGGYTDGIVAGEEPELCARLRSRGWGIRRLDREMTLHDAAMLRFGQWWKRSMRSGYGFAQVSAVRPPVFRRERRSSVAWGLLLPVTAAVSAPFTGGLGLVLLAAYPAIWVRILLRRRARGDTLVAAARYAAFCVLGKFPEVAGVVRYWVNRRGGQREEVIDYK